jgi:AcrR family transcriptional regulator
VQEVLVQQARVLRNDALILDGALDAAAEDGWPGLALLAVARRVGLSQRPVATRFADRSELARTVWRERAGPALLATLEEALSAAGLLAGEPSAPSFRAAMEGLARPEARLRAAAELLVMSNFDPGLAREVESGFGAQLREWCSPRAGQVTRAQAARRAYLLIVALGLVAVGRRPGADRIALTDVLDSRFAALQSSATPRSLPSAHLQHVEDDVPFGTGDPIQDALLTSVLRLVGTAGYEGASTARIARDAGVAEANIFLRYKSKLDLFVDASVRHQELGFPANAQFQQALEEQYGPGVAEAVMIREILRPAFAHQRSVSVEELRVSWHDAGLLRRQEEAFAAFVSQLGEANHELMPAASQARVHMGLATGFGVMLLGIVAPEAGSLPYDVVTIPLLGE